MSKSVDVQFEWYGEKAKQSEKLALIVALQECGLLVETKAKRNIKSNNSIITGTLYRSIHCNFDDLQKLKVLIGTDIEYSTYVEYGTIKSMPKPYLYPAFTQYSSKIESIIVSKLKGAFS